MNGPNLDRDVTTGPFIKIFIERFLKMGSIIFNTDLVEVAESKIRPNLLRNTGDINIIYDVESTLKIGHTKDELYNNKYSDFGQFISSFSKSHHQQKVQKNFQTKLFSFESGLKHLISMILWRIFN